MTVAIDPTMTVADIVTDHPDLARELEHRALDYCCNGRRTLAEACHAAGNDPDRTAAELAAVGAGPPADWADLGPSDLVDHIEATHHAYLHEELPRLRTLLAKVVGAHGARHPELHEIEAAYTALLVGLEPHLAREEQVVFPLIRALPEDVARLDRVDLRAAIAAMIAEHDDVGDLLVRLRDLSGGYAVPPDGCASYTALYAGLRELEADTHLHVHKENNVLVPALTDFEPGNDGEKPHPTHQELTQ